MHSDQKDNAIIVIWKDLVVYQNVGLVGTNDTVLYCTAKWPFRCKSWRSGTEHQGGASVGALWSME